MWGVSAVMEAVCGVCAVMEAVCGVCGVVEGVWGVCVGWWKACVGCVRIYV